MNGQITRFDQLSSNTQQRLIFERIWDKKIEYTKLFNKMLKKDYAETSNPNSRLGMAYHENSRLSAKEIPKMLAVTNQMFMDQAIPVTLIPSTTPGGPPYKAVVVNSQQEFLQANPGWKIVKAGWDISDIVSSKKQTFLNRFK